MASTSTVLRFSNGQVRRVHLGDILQYTDRAKDFISFAHSEGEAEVINIEFVRKHEESRMVAKYITVYDWDEEVSIRVADFVRSFYPPVRGRELLPGTVRYLKKGTGFKGKDLGGKKCRVLSMFRASRNLGAFQNSASTGKVFVELEEDVGAFSCDGLGKKGHCVIVSVDSLVSKEEMLRLKKILHRKF